MLFEFLRRAIWALFGIPALLVIGYVGGWWITICCAVLAVIGMAEYYSGITAAGHRPLVPLGYAAGVGIIIAVGTHPEQADALTVVIMMALVMASLVSVLRKHLKQHAITSTAVTVFGVMYVGILLSYILRLRAIDVPGALGADVSEFWHRMGGVVLVMVPVWCCDTAAFLGGKWFGKKKMAPAISPNKTLVGAISGFLAAVGSVLLIGWYEGIPIYHTVTLGVLVGCIAQVGDLASSVIKRNLKIDDFGTIFGAHGGFLDRFDALIFSLPLVYYYIALFVMGSLL